MYLTTRGLVLREAKYKESDKILTILTETDGKISAKARGVQRTRSKIAAASQLLSFSDFTFFGSRGKWTINEAESLEQFRALRGDIELLALGSYIAELLEAVANENVPEPEILQLGLNALYALSNRLCPPAQVKAAFELRLMSLAGYRPQLDECAGCGRREPESGRLFPEHGELFCPECRAVGGLRMDRSVIDAMRYILDADPRRVFAFRLPEAELRALGGVTEAYALYELDRAFGSLDYYKKLRKDT
ncbi:MAG TPA: DNA repair protein RecO [Candidatus Scatomorpha stercoravium]|nr:DNA repair protein RecO [Candidatus Scatomorpha stercoravium]